MLGLLSEGFLRQECVIGMEPGKRCSVTSRSGCLATSYFPLCCVSGLCLGASQINVICVVAEARKLLSSKVGGKKKRGRPRLGQSEQTGGPELTSHEPCAEWKDHVCAHQVCHRDGDPRAGGVPPQSEGQPMSPPGPSVLPLLWMVWASISL